MSNFDEINIAKLTKHTKFAGCGAKLGPALLDKALCGLNQPSYPNIIADFKTSDDAGIYKLTDEIALVQTVDFFPPIVDDPYTFGQIAAANSLSDIYAMGGKPVTALSVVGFPKETLDIKYLREIMEGGLNKLIEAETALVGGHSVEDSEVKFGFAISGTIHPKKVLLNNTIKSNELLILTKPIGTGAINTALRADLASDEAVNEFMKSMATLNKKASEIIIDYPVSACTDITGFGLLGHACEMIIGSSAGITFEVSNIKLFPDTMEYISMGLIPAGTYRNREFRERYIKNLSTIKSETLDLLFDPQTSGGLLFSVPEKFTNEIISKLEDSGVEPSVVGFTTDAKEVIEINE